MSAHSNPNSSPNSSSIRNPLADALVRPLEARESVVLELPGRDPISGRALYELTGKFANALAGSGVGPGDRVAMQAAKSAEGLALYLACIRMGALFLPLNTAYTHSEIEYFLEDAEPTVFVCDPESSEAFPGKTGSARPTVLTMDEVGRGTLMDRAERESPEFRDVERATDDIAAILYTSGTTGRSKGAMLSHGNLLSNAETLAREWRFTADDTLLHVLPIFHAHGLFVAANVLLLVGGSMIFMPKFDPDGVFENLRRATSMMGVPTHYTRLLADSRLDRDACANIRLFVSGSAPLLADTHREFEERSGHRILERYGMTETTMIASNPYDGERRAGTVGFPLPGVETRVVDAESGIAVSAGDVGILEVRGPNVFRGYWRMPEKTAEEFREDGFFRTGDLARVDVDRYITIVGRQKDLVISGGYNVYPKEVEAEIDALDGVVESAVFGVPHADLGEAVVATVVCGDGEALDAERVRESLAGRLAGFKRPKHVVFLKELPRNSMGKVQKAALRQRFRALLVED